jgi:hypothetical protein
MLGNKSSSWHDYNESLIERGRILIDVSFLKSANVEIKKMNDGKIGAAPFQYGDSYIQFIAFLKIGFKIPYRTVQAYYVDYQIMLGLLRKCILPI